MACFLHDSFLGFRVSGRMGFGDFWGLGPSSGIQALGFGLYRVLGSMIGEKACRSLGCRSLGLRRGRVGSGFPSLLACDSGGTAQYPLTME